VSDEDLLSHAEDFLVGAVICFLFSLLLGPLLLIASAICGALWISTHLLVLWRNRDP
jgi:hypothetical protein